MIDPKELIGQIICDDMMNILPQLPDKCIDLILTDPPYGIGESTGKNRSTGTLAKPKEYAIKDWDKFKPTPEMFKEMFRVSKHQIIFGGNFFADNLPPSSCWLVWDKQTGTSPYADAELAYTNFKGAVRKYEWLWSGMLQQDMTNKEERIHPTQKPVGLFMKILLDWSKEGQLILDPFAGSGTTAIACHKTKRNFICIEKESDYVEGAKARLTEVQKQLTLF